MMMITPLTSADPHCRQALDDLQQTRCHFLRYNHHHDCHVEYADDDDCVDDDA